MRTNLWWLCLLLLGIMTVAAVAEDLEELLASANAAYEAGQYQECIDLYGQAIEQGEERPGAFYNVACCCALTGNQDQAFAYLTEAVELGYHNCEWIQQDSDLKPLQADPRWADLVARCDAANETYLQSINRELFHIYQQDQSDRLSGEIDWSLVSVRDHERQERVRQMLDSGLVKAPDDYYHAAMVFQHGDDSTAYSLAHALALKAVELGSTADAARWLAAAAKDRYLWSIGEPQWYGTQYHQIDGEWTIDPIDTTAVTDKDRGEWDVPPLAQARKHEAEMNGE